MFLCFLFLPVLACSVFGNKKLIGVGSKTLRLGSGSVCMACFHKRSKAKAAICLQMKFVFCVSACLAFWALDLLSSNTDGWNSSEALTSGSEIGLLS